MGKAKWVVTGLIAVGATIYKLVQGRKEKDERFEKILKMAQIDQEKKEPEEKVEEAKTKTVEELTNDVDDALNGMDIDDGEETQVTDEPKGKTFEQIEKDYQNMKATKQAILDNIKPIRGNDPDYFEQMAKEREAERQKRFDSGEWLADVEKAKENKNFSKLEDLFNEKYNPYPYHPAPSSPFCSAYGDGLIDDKLLAAARKYYGNLWGYSGD